MKKYLLNLSTIFFLLVFVFLPKVIAFAQFPSFEVYCSTNCAGKNATPYPLVSNVVVTKSSSSITITAFATDVSGIASLVALIKDPDHPGKFMNSEYSINGIMHDDGTYPEPVISPATQPQAKDGWYGLVINITNQSLWNPNAHYVIDISATDNLLNNSLTESNGADYVNAASFNIENPNVCNTVQNAQICISTTLTTPSQLPFYINGSLVPVSVAAGTQVTLTANLGIGNQIVRFVDQTASVNIGSAVTDPITGIATIKYISSYGSLGSHTFVATYEGGSSVPPEQGIAHLVFTSAGNCIDGNGASVCVDVSIPSSNNSFNSFTVSTFPQENPVHIITSSQAGHTVNLNADLGLPGQTVIFTDQPDPINNPDTKINIGSVITNSSGVANIQYPTALGATIDDHILTAKYLGGSATPASIQTTLIITSAGNCKDRNGGSVCISTVIRILTLSSSANPSVSGANITLTATLSDSATGLVTFNDGSSTLGTSPISSGTATYNASSLTVGTHALTAVYSGYDDAGPRTSNVVNQEVDLPGHLTFHYTGSYQYWTVPAGVTSIIIKAIGASGGYNSGATPGNGASIQGTFSVIPGDVLAILVGQSPGLATSYPGGGGGTFVGLGSSSATATPLIVAGGGGGANGGRGVDAPITNDGTGTNPGTSGSGAPAVYCAGGGGGFYSNGGDDTAYPGQAGGGGYGFRQGGAGGTGSNSSYQQGGFGGGAEADYIGACNTTAGAGGGYGGGSGYNDGGGYAIGQAGGSYNNGTDQSNSAGFNNGDGSVIINYTP